MRDVSEIPPGSGVYVAKCAEAEFNVYDAREDGTSVFIWAWDEPLSELRFRCMIEFESILKRFGTVELCQPTLQRLTSNGWTWNNRDDQAWKASVPIQDLTLVELDSVPWMAGRTIP